MLVCPFDRLGSVRSQQRLPDLIQLDTVANSNSSSSQTATATATATATTFGCGLYPHWQWGIGRGPLLADVPRRASRTGSCRDADAVYDSSSRRKSMQVARVYLFIYLFIFCCFNILMLSFVCSKRSRIFFKNKIYLNMLLGTSR